MFKLAQCILCKATFTKTLRNICDACYEKEKKCILDIAVFFHHNPDKKMTLQELSMELNVEMEYIEDLFNTKKLEEFGDRIYLKCSNCNSAMKCIPNKMYLCGICMVKMGLAPRSLEKEAVKLKHFDKNIYHSKKPKL